MDATLINFLLQNIGLPVVLEIIKAKKAANSLATITAEDVATEFVTNTSKYIAQGNSWLANNPQTK